MDVSKLPFNQLIGLVPADPPTGALLELPADRRMGNHLGTVHASAIFGLAEAASGQFLANLLSTRKEKLLPVLRRSQMKYRRPGEGVLRAFFGRSVSWTMVLGRKYCIN